jgi:hypothetical protein
MVRDVPRCASALLHFHPPRYFSQATDGGGTNGSCGMAEDRNGRFGGAGIGRGRGQRPAGAELAMVRERGQQGLPRSRDQRLHRRHSIGQGKPEEPRHRVLRPWRGVREQTRPRPRHCRLQSGARAQSWIRDCLCGARQRLEQQGRSRPRACRLRQGDPARSQGRGALQQPGARLARQGQPRQGDRRPDGGDPARQKPSPTASAD